MSLKVVGAGLGRTGTFSLKLALEKLLDAPCYHMYEVFQHPEHVPIWHAAALNQPTDWDALMTGYGSAVDWPASAFWKELAEANPESLILLSVRDPESWWESASETIFRKSRELGPEMKEWLDMLMLLLGTRFTSKLDDKQACIDAFNRHTDTVIREAPKDRLLVWRVQEGWAPICEKLGLPVPDEAFPKSNTKEEFLARKL